MSEVTISKKDLILKSPSTDAVVVDRDVKFRAADGGTLTLDVYRPRDRSRDPLPAVVIAAGYPDPGYAKYVGCRFKELQSIQSWARLMAASGLAAIAYENREPAADFFAVLHAIESNPLLDAGKLAVWACSGHVPVALSALMRTAPVHPRCAALLYGYMLDFDGSSAVADAASAFRFANPCAGRTMSDLEHGTPLLVVRCGRDEMPHIHESIDGFVRHAIAEDAPVTVINHPDAPHAFDLFHDSDRSREIIGQIVRFLRFHLIARDT